MKVVTIYMESTPNPTSLKFVANFMLVPEGVNLEFHDPNETEGFPLLQRLFQFPFVTKLYVAENYITVSKSTCVHTPIKFS